MKSSGKSTLPPQQLLCETDSRNVDIEMKHLIIWSHPLANVPVGFFHPMTYFQILQINCLLVLLKINLDSSYMRKNVPHFVKAINPLTSDYNKKETE